MRREGKTICIIIAKPAGARVPREHLVESARRHYDGWGCAYREGGEIKFVGGWTKEELVKMDEVPEDVPWLFHARAATHGAKPPFSMKEKPSKDAVNNRQPFLRSSGGWAVAHNGVLGRYVGGPNGAIHGVGPSDSRLFAQEVSAKLSPEYFPQTGKRAQDERRGLRKLVGKGWNKVAFLLADENLPSFFMAGEWVTEGGVYYSNRTFEPIKAYSGGSYYGGHSKYNAQYKPKDQPMLPMNSSTPEDDHDRKVIEAISKRYAKSDDVPGRAFLRSIYAVGQISPPLLLCDVEMLVDADPEGAAEFIFNIVRKHVNPQPPTGGGS